MKPQSGFWKEDYNNIKKFRFYGVNKDNYVKKKTNNDGIKILDEKF